MTKQVPFDPTDKSLGNLHPTSSAAKKMGHSPRTVEDWRTKGLGPKYLKIQRKVLYSDKHIDEYLATCVRRSTADTEPLQAA